jgi:energy-converting hydrogenase A subunit M
MKVVQNSKSSHLDLLMVRILQELIVEVEEVQEILAQKRLIMKIHLMIKVSQKIQNNH